MRIIFAVCVSCLSFYLVSSLQPCGNLLGNGWLLGSFVCDASLCNVTLPCGVLGQEWYLIVSIPDPSLLLHFD